MRNLPGHSGHAPVAPGNKAACLLSLSPKYFSFSLIEVVPPTSLEISEKNVKNTAVFISAMGIVANKKDEREREREWERQEDRRKRIRTGKGVWSRSRNCRCVTPPAEGGISGHFCGGGHNVITRGELGGKLLRRRAKYNVHARQQRVERTSSRRARTAPMYCGLAWPRANFPASRSLLRSSSSYPPFIHNHRTPKLERRERERDKDSSTESTFVASEQRVGGRENSFALLAQPPPLVYTALLAAANAEGGRLRRRRQGRENITPRVPVIRLRT